MDGPTGSRMARDGRDGSYMVVGDNSRRKASMLERR